MTDAHHDGTTVGEATRAGGQTRRPHVEALAVFDLDGTLVDTAPDLTDTCNIVLAEHGYPQLPAEQLKQHIGYGARAMIAAALKQAGVVLGDTALDAMHERYLALYEPRIARHSRPFPEISAALDDLDAAGVALAVCTNKKEHLARVLLDTLDLTGRFVAITGGDTFAARKPDGRHLLWTVERAGGEPARTVFVGDSRVDRETATDAAVPMVGLSYGYTDVPMSALAPDRLCGPGDDIAAAILGLLRERGGMRRAAG